MSVLIWISVIWFLLAVMVPKRLLPHERYAMWMFTIAFAWTFDVFFGIYLDLYDYGPSPNVELRDMIQLVVTNPSIALIFLNFLPTTTTKRIGYVAVWSAFLILHEAFYVKAGYMTYKGWSLGYSTLLYPLLLMVMLLNLVWFRRLVAKSVGTCKKATD